MDNIKWTDEQHAAMVKCIKILIESGELEIEKFTDNGETLDEVLGLNSEAIAKPTNLLQWRMY